MEHNFESFLADIHGKQFIGTKDTIIEDYEQWLQDLSPEEWIKFGDKYSKKCMNSKKSKGKLIGNIRHPYNCYCETCRYDDDNFGGC